MTIVSCYIVSILLMCLWNLLVTLSAILSHSSNHAVNAINFRKKNTPGKAKPKENNGNNGSMSRVPNQNATVGNGACTRCKSHSSFHLGQVKADGICTISFEWFVIRYC